MTSYTTDEALTALFAVRRTGFSSRRGVVALLPTEISPCDVVELEIALTEIMVSIAEHADRDENRTDRALAAAETTSFEETWRQLLLAIQGALEDPDPDEEALQELYEPAERSAHRAGRALARIADAAVTGAVVTHVVRTIENEFGPPHAAAS